MCKTILGLGDFFTKRNTFLYAGFIAFLILNIGDIQTHICLDGQEQTVSLHFENLDGHPDHSGDNQVHNDFDYEITQDVIQSNSSDLQQVVIFNTHSELMSSFLIKHSVILFSFDLSFETEPSLELPPLRAPPAIS